MTQAINLIKELASVGWHGVQEGWAKVVSNGDPMKLKVVHVGSVYLFACAEEDKLDTSLVLLPCSLWKERDHHESIFCRQRVKRD